MLGTFSILQTLGFAARNRTPARAYAFAPGDARVAAQYARHLLTPDADARVRARAEGLAREALLRDPTAVAAATTLGLSLQLKGDARVAQRALRYAGLLSRRDLPTRLWFIEEAVARNDVEGALQHYDIALRTSRAAPGVLFPILSAALADPAIRSALATRLRSKPKWGEQFIEFAAANPADPAATAHFFIALEQAGGTVEASAKATLMTDLVARDLIEAAWSLYAASNKGVARQRSRDPNFAATSTTPSPFDWQALNDAGMSASLQRDGRDGLVEFSAPAMMGGPLLQQLQLLPPGAYRLHGHSTGVDLAPGARPYWLLRCRNGQDLGRVELPNSDRNRAAFSGRFDVPAGCPAQILVLVAQPSDQLSGLSGRIDDVLLEPYEKQ